MLFYVYNPSYNLYEVRRVDTLELFYIADTKVKAEQVCAGIVDLWPAMM
jgi:hypothetical protein